MALGGLLNPPSLSILCPRRTISSTKYVDDGTKYGVVMSNNNNGMEEIKYVTSSCSLDTNSVSVPNGQQQQMNQTGGQSSGIMVTGSGGEEESLGQQQQQQHQVKSEDNSHSYVLPPFLH